MNAGSFTAQSPGRLIEVVDNIGNPGLAFLPNVLPPRIDLGSKALRLALSSADQEIARLDGVSRRIARPQDLFAGYLRREAVLSSKIEGTHTTIGELALFEAAREQVSKNSDAGDVSNYVKAFEFGRMRCDEIPVGGRLFQELHQILMESSDSLKTTPGEFRDCVVVIGRPPLATARFVPPPPHFVRELIEDLEAYLLSDDEAALIKLAVAHYQFEAIHPFRDGNGRIGRLLISLWLQKEKILSAPMLYLSAFFERNQQQYYDALLKVSTEGAWEEWIRFFLEGVATQSRDAIRRTQRLVDLRTDYRERISSPRMPANLTKLIDNLFAIPATSVPAARDVLGVSYQAARASIDKLVALGILDPEVSRIGGTGYYFAPEVIRILEEPDAAAD